MASFEGSITTNKGIALIGKLLASKGALEITRVAVGDGTPPADPKNLNGLVHQLKNATIDTVDNPQNGEANISISVSSVGVTTGFLSRKSACLRRTPTARKSSIPTPVLPTIRSGLGRRAQPLPTWRPMTSRRLLTA